MFFGWGGRGGVRKEGGAGESVYLRTGWRWEWAWGVGFWMEVWVFGWRCEVGREGVGELRKGGGRRALGKDGRIGKEIWGTFGE